MAGEWVYLDEIEARFRPIGDSWPDELTDDDYRVRSQFSSTFMRTLYKLKSELSKLNATAIVVQLAIDEAQIRVDGFPRSGAHPEHPGVIVTFDSDYGPLKYATDVFTRWQDNLRAIALGLESLRRVDRYGITRRGEQYAGWKALGAGMPMGPAQFASQEKAARWMILEHEKWWPDEVPVAEIDEVLTDPDVAAQLYRDLTKRLHPDTMTGDHDSFTKLQAAKATIS